MFGDAEALRDLEEILHPLVRARPTGGSRPPTPNCSSRRFRCCSRQDRGQDFDYTVAVTVPEERRRAWAEERGVDEAALAGHRGAAVLTGEEKARRADLVVQNDGDLDRLREQAEGIGRRILRERGSHGRPTIRGAGTAGRGPAGAAASSC